MVNKELEILKDEIREINSQNNEELIIITNQFIEAYAYSFLTYGLTHEITRDTLKLFCEFKSIIDEEKNLYRFMLKMGFKIDLQECYEIIDALDELNVDTYTYYNQTLNDIIVSCETKCVDRAKHYKRNFKTLIETSEYIDKVIGLTLTFSDVKTYLNYEEEFWDFIDSKITIIDSRTENNKYGVFINDDNIEIFIPYIINLETANKCKEILTKAYNIYKEKYIKKR